MSENAEETSPDELAAESLFRATADDIWRFVRRRVASAQDADDLCAEVFAVAWRRRAHRLPADEQRLWLFGVARRVVLAHSRAATRRASVLSRLAPSATHHPGIDVGEREALADALAGLPERDREVLLLRAWDGLPVTDIATLLGVTPNAVSVRLSKTRRRLEDALRASGEAPALDRPGESSPRTSLETS